MQKKANAWGMMTLHAEDKEKVTAIFGCLKKHLMQRGSRDYSFAFVEDTHFFEEEKGYTLISYFEGTGRTILYSCLEKLGKCCTHDSAVITEGWEAKFEFTEESREYDLLCRETVYFCHRKGENVENIQPVETVKQSFSRNAYTLSHFTDYTEKDIARALDLGGKYRNSENYEEYRKQCLRKAAASYRTMNNTKLTVAETEKKLVKMFPFLQKEEEDA